MPSAEQAPPDENKRSLRLVTAGLLALFFGFSLFLRVVLPYDKVFVGDWIKFTTNDAYFFMRQVDTLAQNFPHLTPFDPYIVFPGGVETGNINLWVYMIAGISWVIGLGSPTQHTVDLVAAYFPAILGGLAIIPAYFIGKALLSRWAGIIAAGLMATFSGEFLGRSILGNADYHVAEVLYTTTAMLFLLLAIKAAKARQITFEHFRRRDWATVRRPLIFSVLAGVFLGMYLNTWPGALLFVFIITVFFIIQFVIDHLKNRNTDYLCSIGVITWLVALAVFIPILPGKFYVAPLVVAMLVPLGLNVLSRLIRRRQMAPVFYPAAIACLGLAVFGIFHLIAPSLLNSMTSDFTGFFAYGPSGFGSNVTEMRPFLAPFGSFSFFLPWGSFTTSFFLGLTGLAILVYVMIKHGEAEVSLIVVWSLIILAATLGQRRNAYYLTANLAVLSGYFCWQMLHFLDSKKLVPQMDRTSRKERRKKRKAEQAKGEQAGSSLARRPAAAALGAVVIFFLVFYPNIGPLPNGDKLAIDTARTAHFAPSDAWVESLVWLKDNTPDPFGEPGSYYRLYERPAPGQSFEYPDSAYGVIAWWDYGYWVTRIAQRLPTTTPAGQRHAIDVANYFLTDDDEKAGRIVREMSARYVMIDYTTAMYYLVAIAQWADRPKTDFYEVFYRSQSGKLQPATLFYPEFYRAQMIRLYNFDGKAVTPAESGVVSYEEKTDNNGNPFKLITSLKPFKSYEEAHGYISSQQTGKHKIVGTDPFSSPVPLEAATHYRLVHASDERTRVASSGTSSMPSVKTFEYVP